MSRQRPQRPSVAFATTVARGPLRRDEAGRPVERKGGIVREPIVTAANRARRLVEAIQARALGRPLSKRERRDAKKAAARMLAAAAEAAR